MFKQTVSKAMGLALTSNAAIIRTDEVELTCTAESMNFLNQNQGPDGVYTASVGIVITVPDDSGKYHANFEFSGDWKTNPFSQAEEGYKQYLTGK